LCNLNDLVIFKLLFPKKWASISNTWHKVVMLASSSYLGQICTWKAVLRICKYFEFWIWPSHVAHFCAEHYPWWNHDKYCTENTHLVEEGTTLPEIAGCLESNRPKLLVKGFISRNNLPGDIWQASSQTS
jgi:hypothetical protein